MTLADVFVPGVSLTAPPCPTIEELVRLRMFLLCLRCHKHVLNDTTGGLLELSCSDMGPTCSSHDRPYSALRDTKLGSQLVLIQVSSGVLSANIQNLCISQCRAFSQLTDWTPSLRGFITLIGEVITKPKMRWIDARRIVSVRAIVKHPQPRRNWSAIDNPGNSMCTNRAVRSDGQLPVPELVSCASPKPAGFRLVDLCPETFFDRSDLPVSSAGARAKFAASILNAGWMNFERSAAPLAPSLNSGGLIQTSEFSSAERRAEMPPTVVDSVQTSFKITGAVAANPRDHGTFVLHRGLLLGATPRAVYSSAGASWRSDFTIKHVCKTLVAA